MAEEDILFGKNRHLFGGIPPGNMQTFEAYPTPGTALNPSVSINCVLPTDTMLDADETTSVCSVGGAWLIRTDAGVEPQDEFSGIKIADATEDGIFIDTSVVPGSSYTYWAFPYSKHNVFNRQKMHSQTVAVKTIKFYFGFDMDMDDPDPDTRITYPSDVQNASYVPAGMDFANDIFDYGSWPEVPSDTNFMPKPCVLNMDGTVRHYLNPNNYTQTVDGAVSDVGNSAYNSMMEWPKIYTKRWQEGNIYKFRCSDSKIDDDYECWCNYDVNGDQIPHFYTSIFPARSSAYKSYSSSIEYESDRNYWMLDRVESENDTILSNMFTAEWLADRLLIVDLLFLILKTTNVSSKMGECKGRDTGLRNSRGLFYGLDSTSASNGQSIKVFGMVNWWEYKFRGNIGWVYHRYEDGSRKGLCKITPGPTDGGGSGITQRISTVDQFISAPFGFPSNGDIWIKDSMVLSYGRLPVKGSEQGSSTTYDCSYADLSVYNGSSSSTYYADFMFFGKISPFSIYCANTSVDDEGLTCVGLSCRPILNP